MWLQSYLHSPDAQSLKIVIDHRLKNTELCIAVISSMEKEDPDLPFYGHYGHQPASGPCPIFVCLGHPRHETGGEALEEACIDTAINFLLSLQCDEENGAHQQCNCSLVVIGSPADDAGVAVPSS